MARFKGYAIRATLYGNDHKIEQEFVCAIRVRNNLLSRGGLEFHGFTLVMDLVKKSILEGKEILIGPFPVDQLKDLPNWKVNMGQ